jgi:transcriptional regulator with XRE-family HTH domain
MRLHGRVYKDGKFWLAEVPMLDAMTQGRTRKEALAMAADLLETLANRPGFSVQVHPGKHEEFEVSATDIRGLLSLLLRRQRERSGLSLAEAAARLGAKSRNAYARYERGTSVPTLDKLTELLQAVAPGQDFVLQQSAVLSPHVAVKTQPAQTSHIDVSQQWLKEHGSEYKGQWVAVHNGMLLGVAPTLKQLHKQIGPEGKTAQTVIVKVLS